MRNLARRDARSLEVETVAIHLPDPFMLDSWLRRIWHVVPDPPEAEYIQAPAFMIRCGDFSGDCDDAATLAASVLVALHIQAVFMAIRHRLDKDFSHVFVRVPAYQIDIDPIVPRSQLPIPYGEAMVLEV